jgi:hypothetical protein
MLGPQISSKLRVILTSKKENNFVELVENFENIVEM